MWHHNRTAALALLTAATSREVAAHYCYFFSLDLLLPGSNCFGLAYSSCVRMGVEVWKNAPHGNANECL